MGIFLFGSLFAQTTVTTAKKRVYANETSIKTDNFSSVINPGMAIDGNSQTYSSLNIFASAMGKSSPSQNLIFMDQIPVGAKVMVKVGIPYELLAVLPNLYIQAREGKEGTGTGPIVTLGSLVGALGVGTGSQFELTLTRDNWRTIRATLDGLANVAVSALVYEAYYEVDEPNPGCEQYRAYDVLSGVTFAAGISTPILNVSGAVVDPLNSIDGDPATYLAFNTGIVNALGDYYATAIFRSNYTAGDQINLLIGTESSSFNLNVLSSLTLTTYLDDVEQEVIPLNSNLVGLQAIAADKESITVTPTKPFNRAKLTLNSGLIDAGLYSTLKVYEISKVYGPAIIASTQNQLIYSGHTATLSATPALAGDIITWYASGTTTDPLYVGTTFTTPVLNQTTSYDVYASGRYNCTNSSGRVVVTVTVLDVNKPQPASGTKFVNYSSNIKVTGNDAIGRTYTYTLTGGALPDGLTLNADGTITGTPTKNGNFGFTVTIVDVTDPNNPINVVTDYQYGINIGNVQNPLPVTLEYFKAEAKSNNSLLTWATSMEQNNNEFVIERSNNAEIWIALSSVKSKAANGNSNAKLTYNFTDDNVMSGSNYYRLKQVDLDGNYTYSNVEKVMFGSSSLVRIYPNPTTNVFYIDGIEDGSQLRVFDAVGKLILNKDRINNHYQVSLDGFANGSYFMIIKGKDNQTTKHTIIKK